MEISKTKQIANRVIQGAFFLIILLALVIAVHDLLSPKTDKAIWPWIILVIGMVLESVRANVWKATLKSASDEKDRERASVYKFFFYGVRVVIFVFLLSGLWGVVAISLSDGASSLYVYQSLGMIILILWGVVFLSYFIWAIYFYNVNHGCTEEEWERINEEKRKKALGEFYMQSVIDDEPKYNPYQDETFGLPAGTVRGMIAFTLLFGAICILLVRIGMKNEVDAGTVIWDQHEFFNNAFLMMIAFYFGSRSLEILTKKKPDTPEGPKKTEGPPPPPAVKPVKVPPTPTEGVDDPMKNLEIAAPQAADQKVAPQQPATPEAANPQATNQRLPNDQILLLPDPMG